MNNEEIIQYITKQLETQDLIQYETTHPVNIYDDFSKPGPSYDVEMHIPLYGKQNNHIITCSSGIKISITLHQLFPFICYIRLPAKSQVSVKDMNLRQKEEFEYLNQTFYIKNDNPQIFEYFSDPTIEEHVDNYLRVLIYNDINTYCRDLQLVNKFTIIHEYTDLQGQVKQEEIKFSFDVDTIINVLKQIYYCDKNKEKLIRYKIKNIEKLTKNKIKNIL